MNRTAIKEINITDVKYALGDEYVDSDFIIAEPGELKVKANIFKEPVRLDGGAFAICLAGEARITVTLTTHTLRKGSILIVPRNSIIQYHEHSPDFRTYIVSFDPNLLDGIQFHTLVPLAKEILENPQFELSDEDTELIIKCCRYIAEKATHTDHPYRKQIMQHLLITLFYEISYIFQKQRKTMPMRQKTHNEEVMEDFGKLLRDHYRKERNVEFYADQLCLTPKYLSTMIKKTSGKSVPEWIRFALVMDAKMQLKYSTQTVQQISEELQFPNPSFFGRFFKKHVGVTPLEYRMNE